MSLLRNFSQKKLLPILKKAYEEDPENFISDLSSLNYVNNNNYKTKEKYPYSRVNTVFYDIFNSDNKYVDMGESLKFVLDKGYDLFKSTGNSLVGYDSKTNFAEFSDLIKVTSGLIDDVGVEDVLTDYFKGIGVENVRTLFKKYEFPHLMFLEKKNKQELLKLFPVDDENKKIEILLGLFKSYSGKDRKITGEDWKSLSDNGRETLLHKICEDSLNLVGRQTKNDCYHTTKLVDFVNGQGLKDVFTDKEKSYLLTVIPQKHYYKEMASALKMRFNSSKFEGPAWKNLAAAAKLELTQYQPRYPAVDTDWSDLVIVKAEDKAIKVDGLNVYDIAFYIINKNSFYSNCAFLDMNKHTNKETVDGKVKGLLLSRLINFVQSSDEMVDSFFDKTYVNRAWKEHKNSFLASSLFFKNLPRIVEKFDQKIVIENIMEGSDNEHKIEGLKVCYENEIPIAKLLNDFSRESEKNLELSKSLLMNVCNNAHSWLEPKDDLDFFFKVITSLGEDYFNELTKNQNPTRSNEFNAAIEKKRLETTISQNISNDDDNHISAGNLFKL